MLRLEYNMKITATAIIFTFNVCHIRIITATFFMVVIGRVKKNNYTISCGRYCYYYNINIRSSS
jgi:hypothetical protein